MGPQPAALRRKPDELPGPRLLLRPFGLHRERSCPGPGLPPIIAATAGTISTGPQIAAGAAAGDPACRATLDRYAGRLARALASVINIIDPDAIVLGGGLSAIAMLYDEVPRRWGRSHLLRHGRRPACCRRATAIRAGCAAPPGCGRRRRAANDQGPVPRLRRALGGAAGPRRERCPECGSPRLVAHDELAELAIAHLDCDAFYATVEKRDRPELAELPVIVGGGRAASSSPAAMSRGFTACARRCRCSRRSPLCPDAVVIRPDMAKYREVGRAVRAEMQAPDPARRAAVDRRGVSRSHAAPRRCTAPPRRSSSPRSPGGSRIRSASPSRSGSATTSFSPSSPPTSTSRAASR